MDFARLRFALRTSGGGEVHCIKNLMNTKFIYVFNSTIPRNQNQNIRMGILA